MPRPPLSTVNVLDVIPIRLADWEAQGNQVVLIRPRPRARWLLLPIEWLRYLLAVRRIRLDAVGSAAWLACNGTRATHDLVPLIRAAFGTTAEPVEQRLGQLVRRLRQEGLLAYRGHDPSPGLPGHPLNPR